MGTSIPLPLFFATQQKSARASGPRALSDLTLVEKLISILPFRQHLRFSF